MKSIGYISYIFFIFIFINIIIIIIVVVIIIIICLFVCLRHSICSPASRGFSLVFLSVVLPFSSRGFGCSHFVLVVPKQNASSQNRDENGSTTLRNTREKPLLAGYQFIFQG